MDAVLIQTRFAYHSQRDSASRGLPLYASLPRRWRAGLRNVGASLALTVALSGAPAIAQESTVGSPNDIIVRGRSTPLLRGYLDQVARPLPGRQLARWNAPLCLKIDGFADRYSSAIAARIANAARDVGLSMGKPGCPTAVLIKLTDESDALAHALVTMRPPKIGSLTSDAKLPPGEIAAIEAPRTVRWLTASATVTNDGFPIARQVSGASNAQDLISNANRIFSASLIESDTREDLSSKIILVDAKRLAGVTLGQLADYLAFVTLASPDLAGDYSSTDSVMAAFSPSPAGAPKGLTRQDKAFLEALYTTPAARSASQQRGAIRGQTVRNLTQTED